MQRQPASLIPRYSDQSYRQPQHVTLAIGRSLPEEGFLKAKENSGEAPGTQGLRTQFFQQQIKWIGRERSPETSEGEGKEWCPE